MTTTTSLPPVEADAGRGEGDVMDLEYLRKDAKALVKAYAAGEPAAVARAETVLGERARERFLLSDAQHVVAREQGFRSWADLKQSESVVESGLWYREGEPVVVRVRKRGRWYHLSDGAAAVEKAGRPPGWREVAEHLVEGEYWINFNRRGVIFVGVREDRPLEPLVARVAEASAALYAALLDLS
jgi:hypothetical protein